MFHEQLAEIAPSGRFSYSVESVVGFTPFRYFAIVGKTSGSSESAISGHESVAVEASSASNKDVPEAVDEQLAVVAVSIRRVAMRLNTEYTVRE